MPRRPDTFTQADVARALRAVDQTGVKAEVVLEPDGRIRIIPTDDAAARTKPLTQTAPIRL